MSGVHGAVIEHIRIADLFYVAVDTIAGAWGLEAVLVLGMAREAARAAVPRYFLALPCSPSSSPSPYH